MRETWTEAQRKISLLAEVQREIEQMIEDGATATIELDPPVALQLIALLQLAGRHPRLPVGEKLLVRNLVDRLATRFAGRVHTMRLIDLGWREKDL